MKKKNKIDQNFYTAVKLFNKEKIFYWIGQGSLLGIIRENKLIEWDHDIDICLWSHENKKINVKRLLEKEGFTYRADLGFGKKYDQMSFDKKGGRRVDVNFYKQGIDKNGKKIAYTKWGFPKNRVMKLLDAISNADSYNSRYKFFINKLTILKKIANFIKKILIKNNFFFKYAGYKQPLELLKKFKKINFHGLIFRIPFYHNQYLEYIYGKDWTIPLRKFSWWKLKNLKSDF